MDAKKKQQRRQARARRSHVKARIGGYPRLLVFKSNTTIYSQVIDDAAGKIICGTSGMKLKSNGVKMAEEVGKEIAKMAKAKKISKVVFDRNGYAYHGQVKALADGARSGGLEF